MYEPFKAQHPRHLS